MNEVLVFRSQLHLIRKIWHVSMGVVALTVYYQAALSPLEAAKIFFYLTILDLILESFRLVHPGFNRIFISVMGPFMRVSEKNTLSGFPFYTLGCGLSLALYSEPIAILSILFLIFADPLSSYFGILYGKDRIWGNKSFQGSLAGFMVCYLLTLVYGMIHDGHGINLLIFSFFAGLTGAFSELVAVKKLDDNLSIPVISGLGLTLLNILFRIF